MDLRQIRIDRHVEARRSSLDTAQDQVLDGIEADCSTGDGVAHRGRDLIGTEYLHQPQNLHELALTLFTHLGSIVTQLAREAGGYVIGTQRAARVRGAMLRNGMVEISKA